MPRFVSSQTITEMWRLRHDRLKANSIYSPHVYKIAHFLTSLFQRTRELHQASLQSASGWTWPPPSIHSCHWLCVAVQTRPVDSNYLWGLVKVHYCWLEVIAWLYGVGLGGQCKPWDHSLSCISHMFWSINQDLVCVCLCRTSSLNRLIWKPTHILWHFQPAYIQPV